MLRPEAGAYLANQSAAVGMFGLGLVDRQGAFGISEGWRHLWTRVDRQRTDLTALGGQLSVDGNSSVLQVGSDMVSMGNIVVGVMMGTGRSSASVESRVSGYRASGHVRGTAIGVYGTWLQDAADGEGAYVDGSAQYARFRNEVHGAGLDRERYRSQLANVSLEAGYTYALMAGESMSLFVRPNMQASYSRYTAGAHQESNGTVVGNADAGGTAGRVGVRLLGRDFRAGNQIQPYLGLNWIRSRGVSRLDFNGQALQADVPRDRHEVQAGAEMRFGERVGAWGGLSLQRGGHEYRSAAGQLGLRVAW